MKKLLSIIIALALFNAVLIAPVGCSTTQQNTAYETIFSVETTATMAINGYYTLVINGTVPTNDVPKVSKIYNDIQAAGALAAVTSQYGTNALAPASLSAELTQLMSLIATIKAK